MNTNCRPQIVAQSKYSTVTMCSECKLFYLHIGPVSFQMDSNIFESVCQMMAQCRFGDPIDPRTLESAGHTH
jgi:hypothetical protein